jgi:hypothetical protein
MKKRPGEAQMQKEDEMRPEYDFSQAVRGKHYKPLHEGYSVYIHKADGTTVVQHYKLEDGTVILEPDVRQYFPDSQAVNAALRSLITLMSEMPGQALTRQAHGASGKKRRTRTRSKSVKA